MIVTVTVVDGDQESTTTTGLDKWPAVVHGFRLLHVVIGSDKLSTTFTKLVMLGLDMCLQRYGRRELENQLLDLESLLEVASVGGVTR